MRNALLSGHACITYPYFILDFGLDPELDTRTRKHFCVYVHNSPFCDTVSGTVEGMIGIGLHFSELEMLQ
jgi:hypothetical protein